MTLPIISHARPSRARNVMAAPKEKPPKPPTALEAQFMDLIDRYGLPAPVREYAYCPPRKFRANFSWPRANLLVECEGGVFGRKSGHNSGVGIEADCERSRLASVAGFRVFRATKKSLDEKPQEIVLAIIGMLKPWYADEEWQS